MGREIHEDYIRKLEEKIDQGEGDIIHLKRVRNSLLNVSLRLPPEILGQIFCWRVFRDPLRIRKSQKVSYNFLLVCHHWFEVASCTPELWSYWGRTLKEWLQHYKRPGTAPVDLLLDARCADDSKTPLNGTLLRALQERAKLDAIRSIRLLRERGSLLVAILSTLTPDHGKIRQTSIEIIDLRHVDASNFFVRCRFPKLWYLRLTTGSQFSSWEHIALHTTALTTLVLKIEAFGSRIPTTTQILSILASNPRLQTLRLSGSTISRDDGDRSTIPVPLRHIKKLSVNGDIQPVFRLLQRLDYPEIMDDMTLTVSQCTVEEILGILGPCIRNHIKRDGRFRDGLGVSVKYYPGSISAQVSVIKNTKRPAQKVTFATFTADFREGFLRHDNVQLCRDFVAHVPVEHVVYFEGDMSMELARASVSLMPNIQELRLINPNLDDGVLQLDPKGPLGKKNLLPALQHLHLDDVITDDRSWRPLLPYLIHQTSDGQRISFTITGRREHICKDLVKDMRGLVDELNLDLPLVDDCPFDYCQEGK
jgi:hypothetical protein